jgi:uncharacterized protein YaiL (DUF2058 family)
MTTPYGCGVKTFSNVQVKNAKKQALEEEKFNKIERENRILLEKMSTIM